MDWEHAACFSGYRAEKFAFPFQAENKEYMHLKNELTAVIQQAINDGYHTFYTGACYGFDILAGEIVLDLRSRLNQKITLIAVLPFEAQAQLWSEAWRDRYFGMLEQADEVITMQPRFTRGCYYRRNEYMVNRCSLLICYYDGQTGGTEYTMMYARRSNLAVKQLCERKAQNESNLLYYSRI